MQKGKEWAWLPYQQQAFETLKNRSQQAPALVNPDHNNSYMLHTDVSDAGVGATLFQLETEGLPRLVARRSRKLNKAQLNYPVH